MLFDTGSGLGRVVAVTALAYAAVVVVLRVSGKRTLAKMNAFDLVVTVALGSTLATMAVSAEVPLAEGVVAVAVLCAGQFAVAWVASRFPSTQSLVKAGPTLVVRHGRILDEALRRERLTASEVRQAVRASGSGGLDEVAAVVLETDGTLSVIPSSSLGSADALADVDAWTSRPAHR